MLKETQIVRAILDGLAYKNILLTFFPNTAEDIQILTSSVMASVGKLTHHLAMMNFYRSRDEGRTFYQIR